MCIIPFMRIEPVFSFCCFVVVFSFFIGQVLQDEFWFLTLKHFVYNNIFVTKRPPKFQFDIGMRF